MHKVSCYRRDGEARLPAALLHANRLFQKAMQLNYVPPAGATAEAVDAARKLLMTPRNSHNAAVVTLESLAKALVVKGYTNVDLKYLIASILDAQGMSSAVPPDWRARDPEGNVQKKRLRGSPESDASTTDVFK